MLSKELQAEILEKFNADEEAGKMMKELNIPGLLAKSKEAGYDLTEADITEIFVSTKEFSDDEIEAVSGGRVIETDSC